MSESSRPAVHLRVPGSRRHVFFFRKMVKRPEVPIEPGSVVDVFDRYGAPLGCGFYNPHSEIALRMLGPSEEGLIERRVREAVAFRDSLGIEGDAWRVCHSEGDGLSGLVVDRYGPVHSIELFSLGMHRQVPLLRGLFPNAWVRADERVQELEGFRIPLEKPPDPVVVQEHGVKFRVDFATGHKTGFFCDQRENRREVARLAKGRTLLDLCCYTGGFGVAAAHGGASRVLGIDMDEEALDTAQANA
ncbi:MAG: class I SAM-dependent methyltransferase, partial [Planctomycetota bacterium]